MQTTCALAYRYIDDEVSDPHHRNDSFRTHYSKIDFDTA